MTNIDSGGNMCKTELNQRSLLKIISHYFFYVFFCKIMASKLALFTVLFKNPFRQMTNLHYSFFHLCHRCQVTLKKDDLKKSKILKILKAMIPVLSLATK